MENFLNHISSSHRKTRLGKTARFIIISFSCDVRNTCVLEDRNGDPSSVCMAATHLPPPPPPPLAFFHEWRKKEG